MYSSNTLLTNSLISPNKYNTSRKSGPPLSNLLQSKQSLMNRTWIYFSASLQYQERGRVACLHKHRIYLTLVWSTTAKLSKRKRRCKVNSLIVRSALPKPKTLSNTNSNRRGNHISKKIPWGITVTPQLTEWSRVRKKSRWCGIRNKVLSTPITSNWISLNNRSYFTSQPPKSS